MAHKAARGVRKISRKDDVSPPSSIAAQPDATFESSQDAIIGNRFDGTIVTWKPAAERLYGYGRDEVIGKSITLIIPEDRRDELNCLLAEVRSGRRSVGPFETVHVRKDGTHLEVEITASAAYAPDKNIAGVSINAREVVQRRRQERALRESTERLKAVIRNAPLIVTAIDRDGTITLSEGRALESIGVQPGQMVGYSFLKLYEAVPEVLSLAQRALAGEPAHATLHTRDMSFDTHMLPVRSDAGEVTGAICVSTDVSHSVRTTRELRHALNFQRLIMGAVSDGIAVINRDATITYVNRRMCEISGRAEEDLNGRGIDVLQSSPSIAEAVETVLENGEPAEYPALTIVRADGQERVLSCSFAPLNGRGTISSIVWTASDITEQRKLALDLMQSQKMETVGRLAGGLAHDINNLLTPILCYAELMLRSLPPGGRLRAQVEQIHAAAERASSTCHRMLMFARREVVRPRVVDVNDVVFDIHRLLRRLIGEDVELFIMPSRGRGTVCIDSGQFQQVIINLAVNARDAMPHGGRLTIQIASAEEQANYEGGDACVSIAVTDTGIGMSDETQCHLFEPFFTTKDPGRGTGLGLATCYGVVQEAGGRIAVTSRLGEGSTFTIYLPLDESVAEEAPPPDDAGYLPGGSETVLLVEDEEAVRDLAAFVLGEQGYTVLTAADGDEAMTVARRHPGRIALLLSDVVMPRMGGSELARCLRAREPSLHVLLMSGYTDEEHVGAFSQGEFPFIAKPFSPLALLRRVRDILDGHERTPSANDAPAEEFTPAAAHVDGVPHAAHG